MDTAYHGSDKRAQAIGRFLRIERFDEFRGIDYVGKQDRN
jgi:hypothetical protein